MGSIYYGQTIGLLRYVDVPITAGAANVQYTVETADHTAGDRPGDFTPAGPLDLIGVEVLAKGVTATALKVGGVAVAGGAISSFTNNFGAAYSADPTPGIPVASVAGTAGGAAQQVNSTAVGNVDWMSSGVVQGGYVAVGTPRSISTVVDRNGNSPAPGAQTPISAAIAGSTVVEVDFTGTPATIAGLLPDGNGLIQIPTPGSVVEYAGWVIPADGSLSALLSTAAPITSLPVTAIPQGLPQGTIVTLTSGANTQSWTVSADALAGVTALPVASQTPNFAYPSGTAVTYNPINTVSSSITGGSVPFTVKAADTKLDTFAGQVRLWFNVPMSDPNTSGKSAGTYPNNGIQKGSAGIY